MKKTLILLLLTATAAGLRAQTAADPVIFEVNGKPIMKSEFMRDFLRAVGKDPKAAPTACTYEKRQALTEYVDLFVNFRTKLEDAYALGLDTTPSLVEELRGYRNELAAPYLIDSATLMNILHEAYDRNHDMLHAAHILVRCRLTDNAADTLKAYKQALAYRDRVLAGEDFTAVAMEANEVRFKQERIPPDDPRRADNGDLGNFTVFDMVYPFETTAYGLQVGEVSMPVRTAYGYHIIKLLGRTPYFGHCTFQHIWCADGKQPEYALNRANLAYQNLMEGANFATVCSNYSDDNTTINNGGLLSDMAANRIPPEYVAVMSTMKPGEVSKPFQTSYGWHILKLVKKDSIPPFEEMVPYYRQRLARDVRSQKPRDHFVEQCKKKYNFVDYTMMYMKDAASKGKPQTKRTLASLDECVAAMEEGVFNRQWHYADSMVTDFRPLMSVGDTEYNAVDFMKYVEANQHAERTCDFDVYIRQRYDRFCNDMVYAYADGHLEQENPEFAALVDEYRTGLMIFSYNGEKIWSKAVVDTAGYEAFYAVASQQHSLDNEEDSNYFWNERADVTVVTVADSAVLAPSKAQKLVEKAVPKNLTASALSDLLKDKAKNREAVDVYSQRVEKGHQVLLSAGQWRKGIYTQSFGKGYRILWVQTVQDPCLKSSTEARGYYVSDYQNYIEQQLMEQLRKKYYVVVHQDVVDEITY